VIFRNSDASDIFVVSTASDRGSFATCGVLCSHFKPCGTADVTRLVRLNSVSVPITFSMLFVDILASAAWEIRQSLIPMSLGH
jgi:hypothetical protein